MNSTTFSRGDAHGKAAKRARLANARRMLAVEDRLMFGQIAVEKGILRTEELEEYLRGQRSNPGEPSQRIGAILLREGVLTANQVVEVLREQRRRNLLTFFEDWTEGAPEEVLKLLTDPSRHIEGFILVQKIGSGGMGTVWKSWDQRLRRWVAVKMHGEKGPELTRFLREAYAAGRLRHPSIVPIHRVAEHDGRPYLVMDYIDGGSMEGRKLEPQEAVRKMVTVARAMEYAHSRGIVHRDLKPANLLLDRDGRIYITDFGLATFCDTASRAAQHPPGFRTATGTTMGTPAYMPPEQALGRNASIDTRCDVYSLGATLYQLVTGCAPFVAPSPPEILLKVLHEPPVPPRKIEKKLDRRLERVLLKCLEKDRENRYSTAAALADDLECWLRGEEVQARPPSPIRRWGASLSRHPFRVAGTILMGAILSTGAVQVRHGIADAERREEEKVSAERRFLALQKYGESVERLARDDAGEALRKIEQAIFTDPSYGPLHVMKGRILHRLGRVSEAILEMDTGIRLSPDFAGGYLERGLLYLGRVCAEQSWPAVVTTSTGPRRLPAPAAREAGESFVLRAKEDLTVAGRKTGEDPETSRRISSALRLAEGYEALVGDRPEDSLTAFEELARLPDSPDEVWIGLALARSSVLDFREAVRALDESIRRRPGRARPHLLRAAARWGLLESQPKNADVPSEVAAAVDDVDTALRLGTEKSQAYLLRAMIRHARVVDGPPLPEEGSEALGEYDGAVSAHPRPLGALTGRGDLHRLIGDLRLSRQEDPTGSYLASIQDGSAALLIDPRCAPALVNRALAWLSLAEERLLRYAEPVEELQNAQRDFAAALRETPDDPDAIYGERKAARLLEECRKNERQGPTLGRSGQPVDSSPEPRTSKTLTKTDPAPGRLSGHRFWYESPLPEIR